MSFAQENNILYAPLSYNFQGISVDSALNFIEKDIGYYFIYNAELIADKLPTTACFSNLPLTIILDNLFNNPSLGYQIIQKQIVIFKNSMPETAVETQSVSLKYKTIKGLVLDNSDGTPLPYSTISIFNKSAGSISNLDGQFSFKIKEDYFSDSIVISHLGYEPLFIKVSELDGTGTFKLQEKTISLQEILIRWNDPRELLIKALKTIKENYPDNPNQLRAFYRESLQRNNKYMLYVEGLLDIYKSAYRPTLFSDQAKLLQFRKFTNIETNDSILIKLQGGIDASLTLDLLKNPLNFITLSELHLYNYYYSGIESINNIDAHTILFEPSLKDSNGIYTGTIHIDTKSLAIIRIQFKLIQQSAKNSVKNFVVRSKTGIRVLPKNIEYTITYKKIKDKFYINHIAGNMLLKVKRKKKLLSSNYNIHFEMITTDMTTTNVQRFKRDEKIKSRQILTDINYSYLRNLNQYWGVNNFILPETDLLKALKKFKIEELTYCEKKKP